MLFVPSQTCRVPDEPSPEDQTLANKATIAKTKTCAMKKGLAKRKNLMAAKKKDFIAREIEPPRRLLVFLQADSTYDVVKKVADEDPQALLVRR